jgi:hypothetical protein
MIATEDIVGLLLARRDLAESAEEAAQIDVTIRNVAGGWRPKPHVVRELIRDPRCSMQSWEEVLYAITADGAAAGASASKTILVPDFTLPAGFLYPGRVLKYTLLGKLSTAATPGTWTMSLNWGGTGGTVLATSAAYTPGASLTNIAWWIEYFMTCRSIGTSGTAVTMGKMNLGGYSTTAATFAAQADLEQFPDAPAAVTIDTTTAKALTPAITPSVTTGSMTALIAYLEALT